MSGVSNLRAARKHAKRAAAKRQADENAARHGQSKAEKRRLTAEQTRTEAHLDGHRREGED